MTSNTAPGPYVASSLTYYSDGNDGVTNAMRPYRAFDGDSTDYVASGNGAGWLQLDCGAGFGISPDRVDLRGRGNGEAPASPIILYGSNDGANFIPLATFTFPNWTPGVTKSFSTGLSGAAFAVSSSFFSQSTTTQTYVVPSGKSLILADMWGAGAGMALSGGSRRGGAGGYQYVEIPVAPGDVITYAAGGRGANGNTGARAAGGTSGSGQGNGGRGGASDSGGNGGAGAGGGRSEIYKNGVLVAVAPGGGGGGGSDYSGGSGGAGGGLSGAAAPNTPDSNGGDGGTQSAPGAGGWGYTTSGSAGVGGIGGDGATGNTVRGGGGGGGGYYGGGGGGTRAAGQCAGGGGGSAFAHPTLTRNAVTVAGSGEVPPNTARGSYVNNAGRGADPSGAGTAYDGLIVFSVA
jgi:hypothetical protein